MNGSYELKHLKSQFVVNPRNFNKSEFQFTSGKSKYYKVLNELFFNQQYESLDYYNILISLCTMSDFLHE